MNKYGKYVIIGSGFILVSAAIIAGLILIGSPVEERRRKLDIVRVSNLHEIDESINHYWTENGKLPQSYVKLFDEKKISNQLRDPETKKEYEYKILNSHTYELCAEFTFDSSEIEESINKNYLYYRHKDFWKHPAGRYCYRRVLKR